MSLQPDYTKFQEVFKIFSKEGNDYLTISELLQLLDALNLKLSEDEIEQLEDLDDYGQITLEKFLNIIIPKTNSDITQEELRDSFKDINSGDENIPISKFHKVMTTQGDPLTEDEVDELMRQTEIFNKETVSYKDF